MGVPRMKRGAYETKTLGKRGANQSDRMGARTFFLSHGDQNIEGNEVKLTVTAVPEGKYPGTQSVVRHEARRVPI
jgi:hypothetical protein